MKNLKKVFLAFVMAFAILAVTACSGSEINNVDEDFLEAGYHQYTYKNSIAVNFDLDKRLIQAQSTENAEPTVDKVSTTSMFIPVDRMSLELRALILAEYDIEDKAFTNLTPFTLEEDVDLKVIDGMDYNVYVYGDFEKLEDDSIDSKTAVIIEFPSPEYLREVLEVSQVIQAQLDGKNQEDHINGSLLLLVPSNRMTHYDDIVSIFNQSEKE
ncbi:MAG: hypothetical protein AB7E09_04385 [Candidatus Izemoplasmatales bacterium]